MTFIAAMLAAAVSAAPVPLEDHLFRWIYHTETFGPLLPGELPADHSVSYDPTTGSSWIWDLIQDRSENDTWRFAVSGELLETENEDLVSRAGGTAALYMSPMDWLTFHERVSVWTGSDGNPPPGFSPFHYGLEHGRHLYVDWGYATGVTGPLSASLGRIPIRWGPGRFSQLLISGKAPAMDMLHISLDLGSSVRFTGFTSTIDSDSSTWLSAHRLDIKALDNLRIGLSESVLYSADGIDLAYANLIIPWYPVQWNEREDDNAFLCFDATWQPFSGLALYSEFLIDDIQYENVNEVPNKLGWTFGADGFHRASGLGAVLEYTAVQRYVYSQRKEANYYLHDGRIIGCQLGPDADMATASLSWCGMPGITAELTGSYLRNGEADVYEGWPDSVSTGGPFPSGVVEETTSLSLDLAWYRGSLLEIRAGGYLSSTENAGHQTGESTDDRGVYLQATANFVR